MTGASFDYSMPAGGRGYTRPPSVVSAWSTAPFLLNNSVGVFDPSPSVKARLKSFQDSIEQLLWPEKRTKDSVLGDKVPGLIDRAEVTGHISIASGYLPEWLQGALKPLATPDGDILIKPIPQGTPIGLLANLNLLPENGKEQLQKNAEVINLLKGLIGDLVKLGPNPTDDQAKAVFQNLVGDPLAKKGLLGLSKCPDLVVNRGHYFGTDYLEPAEKNASGQVRSKALADREPLLSNSDKRALIEFIKTF